MRLELCANLMIGGTSPDEDLFRMVRERVSVPVRVLLRPRCGDFLYTESEFELLCRQVKRFAALGADGIVIGVLTPEGDLDAGYADRAGTTTALPANRPSTASRATRSADRPESENRTPATLLNSVSTGPGQRAHTRTGEPARRSSSRKASVRRRT